MCECDVMNFNIRTEQTFGQGIKKIVGVNRLVTHIDHIRCIDTANGAMETPTLSLYIYIIIIHEQALLVERIP